MEDAEVKTEAEPVKQETPPPPPIGQSAIISFEIGSEGELRQVGKALSGGPGAVASAISPDGRTLAVSH